MDVVGIGQTLRCAAVQWTALLSLASCCAVVKVTDHLTKTKLEAKDVMAIVRWPDSEIAVSADLVT